MEAECSVFAYVSCRSFETVSAEVTVTPCGIAEGALGLQIIVSDIIRVPGPGSCCRVFPNSPSNLYAHFLPHLYFFSPVYGVSSGCTSCLSCSTVFGSLSSPAYASPVVLFTLLSPTYTQFFMWQNSFQEL